MAGKLSVSEELVVTPNRFCALTVKVLLPSARVRSVLENVKSPFVWAGAPFTLMLAAVAGRLPLKVKVPLREIVVSWLAASVWIVRISAWFGRGRLPQSNWVLQMAGWRVLSPARSICANGIPLPSPCAACACPEPAVTSRAHQHHARNRNQKKMGTAGFNPG